MRIVCDTDNGWRLVKVKHGLGNHIESRGSTCGSSSTLGVHRSCGESTRIWKHP
ncbi:hypothetical protein YC2023_082514 [Brassica napus]